MKGFGRFADWRRHHLTHNGEKRMLSSVKVVMPRIKDPPQRTSAIFAVGDMLDSTPSDVMILPAKSFTVQPSAVGHDDAEIQM